MNEPLITNDAVTLGILMAILGLVFWTSSRDTPFWKKFYTFVPSLLVAYFLPSILGTFGIVDPEESKLYFMASRYLLPTALVLLTLSIDFKGILNLGPKALIMFLTGTFSIIIGGPIAILVASAINPDIVGGAGTEEVWRGMTTVAGSWIGGGANQAAMKEVFEVGDQLFSVMVTVDVLVANVWMAVLLYAAGRCEAIDKWNGADATAITDLRERVAAYQASIAKIPRLADTMMVLGVGFAATGLAHAGADLIAPFIMATAPVLEKFSLTSGFFWLVVLATTFGMLLALSPVRQLEGVGASRMGSVFIWVLVATIGMKMDLLAIVRNPDLFLLGFIWIAVHAGLLLTMAKIIRAPVFFVAVGSQANVGGAASAPVVASAFHPALAPVGVLLAVLGYALGTYGAWFCGQLMRMVSGS